MTTHSRRPPTVESRIRRPIDHGNPPPQPDPRVHAPDLWYLAAVAGLVSVGLIMMYSTTAVDADPKDFIKLGLGLSIGLALMWLFAVVPLPVQRRFAPLFLGVCFLLLLSLKLDGNPFAVTANGATRWLKLPGGLVQLQPSEFTKLAFVFFAAHFLDRKGAKLHRGDGIYWAGFLGVLAVLGGLIYKEPDLGTALVLGGTAFCMLWGAGIDLKKLFLGVLLLGVIVFFLAWNTDHQRARLLAWSNPWAPEHRMEGGFQVIQSWMAMAKGGWSGVGLGQSTQKLSNRLPESETDFIFAILAEELGLVRAAGVIVMFGLLVWRGMGIAARAPDRYSALVVTGVISWVAVQTCLNLAVVTGTVPNTGVPLPYISSGLSSLTALLAGVGIVLNVSRRTRPAGSLAAAKR